MSWEALFLAYLHAADMWECVKYTLTKVSALAVHNFGFFVEKNHRFFVTKLVKISDEFVTTEEFCARNELGKKDV